MNTATDMLIEAGGKLLEDISFLLGENVRLRDVSEPGSGFFIIGPHHAFGDLTLDKKRLRSRIREDYKIFISITRALLHNQPKSVQIEIDQHDKAIREIIDQSHLVWYSTSDEAFTAAKEAIDGLLTVMPKKIDTLKDIEDTTEQELERKRIIEALEQALETTKTFKMNKASKAIQAELDKILPRNRQNEASLYEAAIPSIDG